MYEGCPISRLTTILLLFNLSSTHGVTNMFVDELFSLLRLHLFPRDNNFPTSLYEAKSIVKWLGLSYNSIHACYNGCVLSRGKLKGATTCPKCKRFVERSDTMPCKVFHHFLLFARLKWMYRRPTLVNLMTWHNANKRNDELVPLDYDSKVWKRINMTWLDFATYPCNIRLGK